MKMKDHRIHLPLAFALTVCLASVAGVRAAKTDNPTERYRVIFN